MGCINGKEDFNGDNPHTYRVINIDADGTSICTGDMTINRAELTLTCAGREPMHWPLNGLRRYGCEPNLFTFEAGRHCQCAEGVYAFRCRRAEQLFLTLQMYIQNPARSLHSVPYRQDATQTGPARPIVRSGGVAGGASTAAAPATDREAIGLGDDEAVVSLQLQPAAVMQQQQHGGLLPSLPLSASLQGRNMRLSSVGSLGGIGPHHAAAYHNDPSASSFATAGNLYQECTTTRSAGSSGGGSSGGLCETVATPLPSPMIAPFSPSAPQNAESNNNVLHKKLSLDIPPTEPAPSPIFDTGNNNNAAGTSAASPGATMMPACGPVSPSFSYYHNEIPSSANYANTVLSGCYPTADYAPDRAYMNVTLSDEPSKPNHYAANQHPDTPRVPTLQYAPASPATSALHAQPSPGASSASPTIITAPYPYPSGADAAASRLYQNLDLPVRRPASAATAASFSPNSSALAGHNRSSAAGRLPSPKTPTLHHSATSSSSSSTAAAAHNSYTPATPLLTCPTTAECIFTEPVSPSMLYIVLDLDNQQSSSNGAGPPSANATSGPPESPHWPDIQLGPPAYRSASMAAAGKTNHHCVPRTPSITGSLVSAAASIAAGGQSNQISGALPPESPKGGIMDYAQIDYNKTMALSSTTTPSTELDSEESRRTRHSSVAKAPDL